MREDLNRFPATRYELTRRERVLAWLLPLLALFGTVLALTTKLAVFDVVRAIFLNTKQ